MHDIGGVAQWKIIDVRVDDRLSLDVGLKLRDPECSIGHGYREVVDFDAVELTERDLHWRDLVEGHDGLIVLENGYYLVLQTPELDVCLR